MRGGTLESPGRGWMGEGRKERGGREGGERECVYGGGGGREIGREREEGKTVRVGE